MQLATLVFAAVAALGTVVVPFYLATPRVSLSFLGFDVLGWDKHSSVQLKLAVHNTGRASIHGLEVRAAFQGQALANAPCIVRFSPLDADQYETVEFVPDSRARFELGEDPRLVTPLIIVAT